MSSEATRYQTLTRNLGDTLTDAGHHAWQDTFTVRLRGGADLDHVALVGTGGALLAEWVPTSDDVSWTVRVPQGNWVLAAAWDEEGTHLAATGPIWRDP